MWSRTLFLFMGDNGAPVACGVEWCAGSNAPYRGGKGTLWEGGVRAPAILAGGWLPRVQHGKRLAGLCHMVDWYATFCSLSGGPCVERDSGSAPADGLDLSPWLSGAVGRSPRERIVLEHSPIPPQQPRRQKNDQPPAGPVFANATGALLVGHWKLVHGRQAYDGWYGDFSPNSTELQQQGRSILCYPRPCVFNIKQDPGEHEDVAASRHDKLSALLSAFRALDGSFHAPRPTSANRDMYCAATAAHGGFMVPWRS